MIKFLSTISLPWLLLLTLGRDIKAQDADDVSAKLRDAISSENLQETKKLMESGADPRRNSPQGINGFDSAIKCQNHDIKKLVLNYKDEAGETPLFKAIRDNDKAKVKLLLQNGASPYQPNLEGKNGLDLVLADKTLDQDLRNALINYQYQYTYDGETPLIRFIYAGNEKLTRSLLENNADPYLAKFKGANAIYFATWSDNPVIREMVFSHKDAHGETPLMKAMKINDVYVIEGMIKSGIPKSTTPEVLFQLSQFAAKGYHWKIEKVINILKVKIDPFDMMMNLPSTCTMVDIVHNKDWPPDNEKHPSESWIYMPLILSAMKSAGITNATHLGSSIEGWGNVFITRIPGVFGLLKNIVTYNLMKTKNAGFSKESDNIFQGGEKTYEFDGKLHMKGADQEEFLTKYLNISQIDEKEFSQLFPFESPSMEQLFQTAKKRNYHDFFKLIVLDGALIPGIRGRVGLPSQPH